MTKKILAPAVATVFIFSLLALFLPTPARPESSPLKGKKEVSMASFEDLVRAAKAGDMEAEYRLGYIYEKGRGIPRDYNEAEKWYLMAAGRGHTGAQVRLGKMYAAGHGVKRDYKEAARWFTMAAEHGNAEAQYNLGVLHSRGDGVPRDYVISYMWLNLAGAGGYGPARKRLDKLEAKMPEREVELAQKLSREFVVKK